MNEILKGRQRVANQPVTGPEVSPELPPDHDIEHFLNASSPLETPESVVPAADDREDSLSRMISKVGLDEEETFPFERALTLYKLFISSLWPVNPEDQQVDRQNAAIRSLAPLVFSGLINFHGRNDGSSLSSRAEVAEFNIAFLEPRGGLEVLATIPSAADFYFRVYGRFNQLRPALDVLEYLIRSAHVFPRFATRNVAVQVVADNIFARSDGYRTPTPESRSDIWRANLAVEAQHKMRERGIKKRIERLKAAGISKREIHKSVETMRRAWTTRPQTLPLIHSLLYLTPSLLDNLMDAYRFRCFLVRATYPKYYDGIEGRIRHIQHIINVANQQLHVPSHFSDIPDHQFGHFGRDAFSESEFDFLIKYLRSILKHKRPISDGEIDEATQRNHQGISAGWYGEKLLVTGAEYDTRWFNDSDEALPQ